MRQVIYAYACDRCPTVYQLRDDVLPNGCGENFEADGLPGQKPDPRPWLFRGRM